MNKKQIFIAIAIVLISCSKNEDLLYSSNAISYKKSQLGPIRAIRPLVRKVVIDGNSLALGLGSTFGGYERMISDSGYNVINVSQSGQTTLQMITNCNDVNYQLSDSCLLIVDECTNDLWYGATADTAYEHIRRYCMDRKSLFHNLLIVVVTPTPRSNMGTPSDFEIHRINLINKLKYNHAFCDVLADAGSDSRIGYTGAELNLTYYYDLVHHTDAGYRIRGQKIFSAIKRVAQ